MAERAALITGASGGIGLAIAAVLAEEGYGLTLSARRPEKLEDAVAHLREAGHEVETVAANVADEERAEGGLRRPRGALRPPRRAGQQRRGRDRRAARRDPDQVPRHAARR